MDPADGAPAPTDAPSPTISVAAAGALTFLASAAVLILEILSLRLLAPYVGNTLQTTTAAIGTVLGGIALGAWAGGRLADRIAPATLLGPLFVLGGALALYAVPMVRILGPIVRGTGPFGSLLVTLIAFLPVAIVLSAVPPVVTRLALYDLDHAGSIVGRMSALGTAGGLVGSFTAGYVFVAAMPVTAAVVGVGAALVVLGAGLLVRLRGRRGATAALTGLLAVAVTGGAASVLAGTPCDVETVYYCARITVDPDEPTGRSLYLDDLRHSYVDLADPTHLELAYTQTLGDLVDVLGAGDEPLRVLHVGGGGFTLPRYLAATQPASRSTVLEVDQRVVELARAELGLVTGPAIEVQVADARTEVAQLPDDSFDLVIGDAFGGLAVPWHLTTAEFLEELRRVLDDDGIYAANLIDRYPFDFVGAELATLEHIFGHVALVAPAGTLEPEGAGNVISLASAAPLPLDALADQLDRRAEDTTPDEILTGAGLDGLLPAPVLTDDWAPVDQLLGL